MKKNSLLFFLLLITSVNAQTLKGLYISQSLEGLGDDTVLNEKSKIPSIYEYVYSNGSSLQTLVTPGKTTIDTIRKKNEKYDFIEESTVRTERVEKGSIFKNFNSNQYENNYILSGKEIFIRDKIAIYKWTITEETKTIDGFQCKKATTQIESFGYTLPIIAWFCEDVPVSDGPIDFNGLPGFIFEVSSGKIFSFKFKNFTFNKKEIVKIEPIKTNAIPKTRKEVEDSGN